MGIFYIKSIILHLLNVYSVQEAVLQILRQKRLIKLTDKSLEHIRHVMLTENIYISGINPLQSFSHTCTPPG